MNYSKMRINCSISGFAELTMHSAMKRKTAFLLHCSRFLVTLLPNIEISAPNLEIEATDTHHQWHSMDLGRFVPIADYTAAHPSSTGIYRSSNQQIPL